MIKPELPSFTSDPYLRPFLPIIRSRTEKADALERRLAGEGSLCDFANAHEFYGLHRKSSRWIFREYAPKATAIWLVGDFSGWKRMGDFQLHRVDGSDNWALELPGFVLRHGQYYHLEVKWDGGEGIRLPAYVRRVVQNPETGLFAAQVWDPPQPYVWHDAGWKVPERDPLIYEAHIGMAQEAYGIGSYREFRLQILPRIVKAGYNTLQLMAIMEHPYYGSFGYQVGSFFAASSRFGTPEDLKELVDDAHKAGLSVIMDIVHSHAVSNEVEGIAKQDGTQYIYFHDGERGHHPIWDSMLFDYGRISTLHFLLSNCRFWLDEYHFDGFRFDGVTSMLYSHHGLGFNFTEYAQYFDATVDTDAYIYLCLTNRLIHSLRPDAITIAEDVSGMPGLAAPIGEGGVGFDLRMAMGVTEMWGKLLREVSDPNWNIGWMYHELTNRRSDERTVSYVECHDQAMVGGKTMFFEMTGSSIYDSMHRGSQNLLVDRAIALHKMERLATVATAGGGYLNFMGNEFGHPEWIDFPREGNGFSYEHARRQWSLRDNPELRFKELGDFDEAMIHLFRQVPLLLDQPLHLLQSDELGKMLVFARGRFFFLFNFNSADSHADWQVSVPPGRYLLRLQTDAPVFGGQGRIQEDQLFIPQVREEGGQQLMLLSVYLPVRTAMVLERLPRDPSEPPLSTNMIRPSKKVSKRKVSGRKSSKKATDDAKRKTQQKTR